MKQRKKPTSTTLPFFLESDGERASWFALLKVAEILLLFKEIGNLYFDSTSQSLQTQIKRKGNYQEGMIRVLLNFRRFKILIGKNRL